MIKKKVKGSKLYKENSCYDKKLGPNIKLNDIVCHKPSGKIFKVVFIGSWEWGKTYFYEGFLGVHKGNYLDVHCYKVNLEPHIWKGVCNDNCKKHRD